MISADKEGIGGDSLSNLRLFMELGTIIISKKGDGISSPSIDSGSMKKSSICITIYQPINPRFEFPEVMLLLEDVAKLFGKEKF